MRLRFATIEKLPLEKKPDADGDKFNAATMELSGLADDAFLKSIGADPRAFSVKYKQKQAKIERPAEPMALAFHAYGSELGQSTSQESPAANEAADLTIAAASVHEWTVTRTNQGNVVKVKAFIRAGVADIAAWFCAVTWQGEIAFSASQGALEMTPEMKTEDAEDKDAEKTAADLKGKADKRKSTRKRASRKKAANKKSAPVPPSGLAELGDHQVVN